MSATRRSMTPTQELIGRVMRIVRACPEAASEVLELMFLVSQIEAATHVDRDYRDARRVVSRLRNPLWEMGPADRAALLAAAETIRRVCGLDEGDIPVTPTRMRASGRGSSAASRPRSKANSTPPRSPASPASWRPRSSNNRHRKLGRVPGPGRRPAETSTRTRGVPTSTRPARGLTAPDAAPKDFRRHARERLPDRPSSSPRALAAPCARRRRPAPRRARLPTTIPRRPSPGQDRADRHRPEPEEGLLGRADAGVQGLGRAEERCPDHQGRQAEDPRLLSLPEQGDRSSGSVLPTEGRLHRSRRGDVRDQEFGRPSPDPEHQNNRRGRFGQERMAMPRKTAAISDRRQSKPLRACFSAGSFFESGRANEEKLDGCRNSARQVLHSAHAASPRSPHCDKCGSVGCVRGRTG